MQVASKVGFSIPPTLITNDPKAVRDFFEKHEGQIVFKALRRIAFFDEERKKMYGFYTRIFPPDFLKNTDAIRPAPLFLQKLVKKKYELRVTVVGSEVFSASIESSETEEGKIDWRKIPVEKQNWEHFPQRNDFKMQCRTILKKLKLQFGTLDFAITPEGEITFFEINPNGQWAWLEMQAGLPISEAFVKLFRT